MQNANRYIAKHPVLTILFLTAELILYTLILTAGGKVLVWSSYLSIVLCFLFAVTGVNKRNALLVCGLLFTVFADFCLVVCQPIQQLWGMVFFLLTQTFYAWYLHRGQVNRLTLTIRIILAIIAEMICAAVLKDKTDALALISIFYYVHLIMNIADAVLRREPAPLLPAAFALFLLCDTVVGLQVMSSGYLPIPEGSVLHDILFSGFNLAWFFYLPSQVLIALSSRIK